MVVTPINSITNIYSTRKIEDENVFSLESPRDTCKYLCSRCTINISFKVANNWSTRPFQFIKFSLAAVSVGKQSNETFSDVQLKKKKKKKKKTWHATKFS